MTNARAGVAETGWLDPGALSVLLIDDDPYALGLERRILEHIRVRSIVTAADGEEALAILETGLVHFDVILSDLHMPGLDGIELLKRVRAGWPEIPFLMLTSDRTEASVLSAQNLGVDGYVAKPFSPSQLLKILRAICERRDLSGIGAWLGSEEYRALNATGDPPLRRLHDLWDERRRGRAMAAVGDFTPIDALPVGLPVGLRQHILLAEVVDAGRFRCLYAGDELRRSTELALEGRFIEDQPAWFRRHMEAGLRAVLKARRPHFQMVQTIESFTILRFQRLLMPLANTADAVGHVLGAIVRF